MSQKDSDVLNFCLFLWFSAPSVDNQSADVKEELSTDGAEGLRCFKFLSLSVVLCAICG